MNRFQDHAALNSKKKQFKSTEKELLKARNEHDRCMVEYGREAAAADTRTRNIRGSCVGTRKYPQSGGNKSAKIKSRMQQYNKDIANEKTFIRYM